MYVCVCDPAIWKDWYYAIIQTQHKQFTIVAMTKKTCIYSEIAFLKRLSIRTEAIRFIWIKLSGCLPAYLINRLENGFLSNSIRSRNRILTTNKLQWSHLNVCAAWSICTTNTFQQVVRRPGFHGKNERWLANGPLKFNRLKFWWRFFARFYFVAAAATEFNMHVMQIWPEYYLNSLHNYTENENGQANMDIRRIVYSISADEYYA